MGPDKEKPASWIDANIHATELTADGQALLHPPDGPVATAWTRRSPRVLDEQAIYVVPRLNPDGAEPRTGGAAEVHPFRDAALSFEDRRDGLYAEDIDGDGRILQMRMVDPWRATGRCRIAMSASW